MKQFELIKSHLLIAGGDFTNAMFLSGADARTWITGIVTESGDDVFQVAFLIANRGFGISVRYGSGDFNAHV